MASSILYIRGGLREKEQNGEEAHRLESNRIAYFFVVKTLIGYEYPDGMSL